MKSAPVLDHLRALPSIVNFSIQEQLYPFSLLPNGLPQTGLVELSGCFGSGKTEIILHFLKENSQLKVAWVEKDFTIFPPAFPEHQVELTRILFIDVSSPLFKQPLFWSTSQILKSQLFPVLVLSHLDLSEIELRRLQLVAKMSGSLVILLNPTPSKYKNWSLTLQIGVKRSDLSQALAMTILKSRNSSLWPREEG